MEEQASSIQKSKDFFNGNRRSFRFTSPAYTDDLFIGFSDWVAASWYSPVKKNQKSLKMISSQQQKQQQLRQQRQKQYLLNTIQTLLTNMAGFKLLVASIT